MERKGKESRSGERGRDVKGEAQADGRKIHHWRQVKCSQAVQSHCGSAAMDLRWLIRLTVSTAERWNIWMLT